MESFLTLLPLKLKDPSIELTRGMLAEKIRAETAKRHFAFFWKTIALAALDFT